MKNRATVPFWELQATGRELSHRFQVSKGPFFRCDPHLHLPDFVTMGLIYCTQVRLTMTVFDLCTESEFLFWWIGGFRHL